MRPRSDSTTVPHCSIRKASTSPVRAGIVGFLLATGVSSPTQANPIPVAPAVVNVDAADGLCSLIEAMENANNTASGQPHSDCAAGNPGGADSVELAAGSVYTLLAAHNPWDGQNGLPSVTGEVAIRGNGSTIARDPGAPPFRILHVGAFGSLTLNELTIANGSAIRALGTLSGDGGALLNRGVTTIVGCTFRMNSATHRGGAVANHKTLTVTDSDFHANTCDQLGGAIAGASGVQTSLISRCLVTDNFAGASGGGIANLLNHLSLDRTTLSDNEAGFDGGGLLNNGVASVDKCTFAENTATRGAGCMNNDELNMMNTTVSGNTASSRGGGIFNFGRADLTGTTITQNTAPTGGGIFNNLADVFLGNTIVTGNAGGDCGPDGFTAITSRGRNLDGDDTCDLVAADDLPGGNAMLDPLADNGGSTWTHALMDGSGAIDNGDCSLGPLTDDQRGMPRPQGAACDIGAFESADSTELTISDATAVENGNGLAFSVERSRSGQWVSVEFSVTGMTATEGDDFIPPAMTTLTFAPNDANVRTILVEVLDDEVLELDETVEITLSGASGAMIIDGAGLGTILDDDEVQIRFGDADSAVRENAAVHRVPIRLIGEADVPVTVDIVDAGSGSAESGEDYAPFGTQTITFPAGSPFGALQHALLEPLDDEDAEGDETVELRIDTANRPGIAAGIPERHEVTILDDDGVTVTMEMDIQPGACPNRLPWRGRGMLKVTLLGNTEVDVSSVDLDSLTLSRADGMDGFVSPTGNSSGPWAEVRDVGAPTGLDPCDCGAGRRDGLDDLTLKFRKEEIIETLGLNDADSPSRVELLLEGTLADGTAFAAIDCVIMMRPTVLQPIDVR